MWTGAEGELVVRSEVAMGWAFMSWMLGASPGCNQGSVSSFLPAIGVVGRVENLLRSSLTTNKLRERNHFERVNMNFSKFAGFLYLSFHNISSGIHLHYPRFIDLSLPPTPLKYNRQRIVWVETSPIQLIYHEPCWFPSMLRGGLRYHAQISMFPDVAVHYHIRHT